MLSIFALFSFLSCNDSGKFHFTNIKGEKKIFELIEDTCVYDQGTHAAFTSLEEWDDELYLTFREGNAHRATETDKGKIRVLKKTDDGWFLQHTFQIEGQDLRDPYFLKWNDKLYLFIQGNYSVLNENGWSELKKIHHDAPHYLWIWKIRSFKNKLYGVGYANKKWPILLSSDNGEEWRVVTTFKIGGNATEADMAFINDRMYLCLRIDNPIGSNSMWGSSEYPFTDFQWSMMPVSISSPEMLYLPKQKLLLLAGREYHSNIANGITLKDVSLLSIQLNGGVCEDMKIDSDLNGDKGYPSFCYYKGILYMSYYSGTSTHSSVRISTFKIK